MKIAYAGFDLFYPMLKALFDNGCEIVKIYSCKVDNVTEFNTDVTAFAQAHNIPITYDRITLSDLETLKAQGVDALFCAAYYYRMPILEGFKMKHIKTILTRNLCESAKNGGCGECQTSCQSACKTSCGIANQKCESTKEAK